MKISKTLVKEHLSRKSKPETQEIIRLALKSQPWIPLAKALASSTRKYSSVNLDDIERETKAGDTVLIVGKVLSFGDVTKKVRICSLGISQAALKKLQKTKSEYASIKDEIKNNPKAQGIRIIK